MHDTSMNHMIFAHSAVSVMRRNSTRYVWVCRGPPHKQKMIMFYSERLVSSNGSCCCDQTITTIDVEFTTTTVR